MSRLDEIRNEIDSVDSSIIELLLKRRNLSLEVAKYKKENNIPIFDEKREAEKLLSVGDNTDDVSEKEYLERIFISIMLESKMVQRDFIEE